MITFAFPGQGSQASGMGWLLFDEFKELTAQCDNILGYSIKDLCAKNGNINLHQTQFTQPALYIVNALSYLKKLKETGKKPNFVLGHSLGEYNALFAAEVFDFETGLKLVKKRGELMSRAMGGGMAAVIGLNQEQVGNILKQNKLENISIANYNSPSQIVISGPNQDISRVNSFFEASGGRYIPLNVSGAFHSRYMNNAKKEFEEFISAFTFSKLTIPVISNISARPYKSEDVKKNLVDQITHPVKWTESIRYLMGCGEMEFEEIGPGNILKRLIQSIQKEATPLVATNGEGAMGGKKEKHGEEERNEFR